jgi:hypothetical protein
VHSRVKFMTMEHIAEVMIQVYEQALVSIGPLFILACKCAVAARGPGKGTAVQWSLKKPLRFLRKVFEKYGRRPALSDIARCSITCDTCKEVASCLQWLISNAEVERIKDRISKPAAGGYRDMLVNVRINGHLCEIQLHLTSMAAVKKHGGHLLFRWLRLYDMSTRVKQGRIYTTTETDEHGRPAGLGHWSNAMGERFMGSFKDGQFDEGMLVTCNGLVYAGKFSNNKPSGLGRTSDPNGTEYFGQHSKGYPDGLGQFFFPGRVSKLATPLNYDGECKQGLPHGYGCVFIDGAPPKSGRFTSPLNLIDASEKAAKRAIEVGKEVAMEIGNKAKAASSGAIQVAMKAKKEVAAIDVWDRPPMEENFDAPSF